MRKIICFVIFFFLFIPNAFASYEIENYYVDITVLENGDLDISEVISLSGEYNGFNRLIYYEDMFPNYYMNMLSSLDEAKIYNSNGIRLEKIFGIDFDLKIDIEELLLNGDKFLEDKKSVKGDYGSYSSIKLENGIEYLIYNYYGNDKDIYLNYKLKNVVVSHEDISEFILNLFPKINHDINNFVLTLYIPNNEEILKVWTHGNNCDVEIIDNEKVIIKKDVLNKNTNLDFRVIFDENVILKKYKKSNEVVYEKIIEIENNWQEQPIDLEYKSFREQVYNKVLLAENKKSEYFYEDAIKDVMLLEDSDELKFDLLSRLINLKPKIERKDFILKTAYSSLGIGWLLLLILLVVYHNTKKDKNIIYPYKYTLELPPYTPSTLGFLLNKKLSLEDLVANLMLLVENKFVEVCFKDNDYLLKKVKTRRNISDSDVRLLKFIFDDKEEILLSDLLIRAQCDYSNFLTLYSNWFNQALIEAEEEEFYEDVTSYKIFGIIYSILGFILGIILFSKQTYVSPIFLILISIVSFVYFILFAKLTVKGRCEKVKWNALKKFMLGFPKLGKKELPKMWSKYLIYSISLGISSKMFNNIENVDFESLKMYQRFVDVISNGISISYDLLNGNE